MKQLTRDSRGGWDGTGWDGMEYGDREQVAVVTSRPGLRHAVEIMGLEAKYVVGHTVAEESGTRRVERDFLTNSHSAIQRSLTRLFNIH